MSDAPKKDVQRAPANCPFLWVGDVADMLGWSPRTVHERARLHEIPHRRPPAGRRLLFIADEIRSWLDGASLEVVELEKGGRVVRPVMS